MWEVQWIGSPPSKDLFPTGGAYFQGRRTEGDAKTSSGTLKGAAAFLVLARALGDDVRIVCVTQDRARREFRAPPYRRFLLTLLEQEFGHGSHHIVPEDRRARAAPTSTPCPTPLVTWPCTLSRKLAQDRGDGPRRSGVIPKGTRRRVRLNLVEPHPWTRRTGDAPTPEPCVRGLEATQ